MEFQGIAKFVSLPDIIPIQLNLFRSVSVPEKLESLTRGEGGDGSPLEGFRGLGKERLD